MHTVHRHPILCVSQVRKSSVGYPNAEDVRNLHDAQKELAVARALVCQLSEYLRRFAIIAMQVCVHICMLFFFTTLREESCFTPYFPRSDNRSDNPAFEE